MQGLTDPPRDSLTADQVRALLTGENVQRGFGADLVDASGNFLEDISADVHDPWKVDHDNTAEIHGSLTINLTRELAWGTARVRPWMTLSKGGVTARFDCGVYLLSTPRRTYGRNPVVFECSGKDLLSLAARQVGDTYVVTKGTTYLSALRSVLTAAGITALPLLDGTAGATTVPADMVWCLSNARWLDVANDLMAGIAYTDVFMSPDGVPRAQPSTDTATRPVEWPFDTSDKATDITDAKYVETQDLWNAYNKWRFVRQGLAYQPVDGDGIYEFTNQSDGLSSVDSIGINEAPVQFLDVADQASLVAEGKRIIEADQRVAQQFDLSVDPLPIAWHRDVVTLTNDRGTFKCLVTKWSLTPYGKGAWTLGGGDGGTTPQPAEQSATATVTQAAATGVPLRVVVDGATTDSIAEAAVPTSGTVPAYAIGDRCQVTIRNPRPPLVLGIATTGA